MVEDLQWIEKSFPNIQEIFKPENLSIVFDINYLANFKFKSLQMMCYLYFKSENHEQVVKRLQQFFENHKSLTHFSIIFNY